MSTRRERLSDLLRIISETDLTPEEDISVDAVERDTPSLMKELKALLDDEFVAGYDYAMDPTAPLLPRNQRKTYYNYRPKRGPGRPKKSPQLPPRPAGKHSASDDEPDDGQSALLPSAE